MATPAPTPAEPAPKTAPAPETPEVPMSRRRLDAEGRIRKDEWNVDAWNTVLNEAAELPFVSADVLYSRLVKQFPTHARYWNARAAHCARDASTPCTAAKNASAAVIPEVVPLGAVLGDSSKSTVSAPESEATATTTEQPPPPPTPPVDPVVQIYEAAVRDAPTSVEIWRAYTAYALSRAPAGQENSVSVIFDRAVEAAGLDLHASPMLQDYIDFLKTRASLSDSQRRDALRRLYHRSVINEHILFWPRGGGRAASSVKETTLERTSLIAPGGISVFTKKNMPHTRFCIAEPEWSDSVDKVALLEAPLLSLPINPRANCN